ncbi:hypothetical protein ACVWWN_006256 [Mycobacterium sp. URHB0021]
MTPDHNQNKHLRPAWSSPSTAESRCIFELRENGRHRGGVAAGHRCLTGNAPQYAEHPRDCRRFRIHEVSGNQVDAE